VEDAELPSGIVRPRLHARIANEVGCVDVAWAGRIDVETPSPRRPPMAIVFGPKVDTDVTIDYLPERGLWCRPRGGGKGTK
jgi:hypothetical protein